MKTYFSTTIYLLFSFGNSLSQTTITNKDYEVTDDVVKIEEYQSKTDSLSTYFSVLRNSNIYNNELYAEKHLSFSYGMLEEKKILDYTLFKDGNPKTYYYIHDVLNNQFIIEELGYDASKKEAKRYPIGRYILYGTPPLQFEFDTNKFQKINKSNNLVVVDDESIELINSNQIKHTYPGIYTKENYKVYNNKGQLIEYNGEYQHSKYYYYEDGLLSEDIDSDGTNATAITRYYYEKDKYDNWVKRIEVRSFQNEKDSETFSVSARKLTYKNGDITGSTDFDETFVKWELMQYVIDFKKEDNVATTEASKSKGCVSGDCKNGFGKMRYDNGNIYEGNFKNGAFHGYGKVYDKNNVLVFEGNHENWKQNGEGKIYYKNGDIYQGNLNNYKPEGKGTFTFANGDVYKGGFVNGKKNGEGIFMAKNGDFYEGTYKNGQLNGKGSYIGKETKYIGDFSEGHFHGEGKFKDKDGITYVGTFIKGTLTGQASAFYKDKLVSQGKMKDFQFDGEVTFYDYTNKKKFVRLYKEGVLLKTISESSLEEANIQPAVNLNTLSNNGLYWKKNEANSFWLYDNGVLKSGGKSFWKGNNLYVYMVDEASLYLLKNYKTETPNTTHQAELLPNKFPNGLWYKTSKGGAMVYNAKGLIIKTTEIYKYDTNGIDVLFKGKDEKETLFLKSFKNVSANVVFPTEIYNPSSSTTSTTTSNVSVSGNSNGSSFQAEIDACKTAGVNCLANKITEKFTTLKNSGVSEAAIFTKLAADFNSIAAYNIKALFDMIFKLDTNILPKEKYGKILAKMSQEQRANLRTYSQKIVDDYKKTHN